jgi:hypothetical protein
MADVYEGNFGFWEIDCPEESAFFEHKICERCKRAVRLIPTKTICAASVSALECGAPALIDEYGHAEPKTASGS